MAIQVHNNSFRVYDRLPSQLERYLIEIIPNLICEPPTIKIDKSVVPFRQTQALTNSIRDILCFSRVTGTAYVYVSETGHISINSQIIDRDQKYASPDFIVAHNAEYASLYSQSYRGVQIDSNTNLKEWKQGSPQITEDVCTAYGLFRNAQERAYLRLKNGNGTLMSLIDGEDEADMLTPDIIKTIDETYENQNRMYAPDGAKLTGISVSLDGIQAVLDTFWENIFRAATIPPWAYEKQQLNSSFTIEHMMMEKKRMWTQQVYPVMLKILDVYCPGSQIDIQSPDFAPEKYRAEVNVLKADVKNRNAVSANNLAQAANTNKATELMKAEPTTPAIAPKTAAKNKPPAAKPGDSK